MRKELLLINGFEYELPKKSQVVGLILDCEGWPEIILKPCHFSAMLEKTLSS